MTGSIEEENDKYFKIVSKYINRIITKIYNKKNIQVSPEYILCKILYMYRGQISQRKRVVCTVNLLYQYGHQKKSELPGHNHAIKQETDQQDENQVILKQTSSESSKKGEERTQQQQQKAQEFRRESVLQLVLGGSFLSTVLRSNSAAETPRYVQLTKLISLVKKTDDYVFILRYFLERQTVALQLELKFMFKRNRDLIQKERQNIKYLLHLRQKIQKRILDHLAIETYKNQIYQSKKALSTLRQKASYNLFQKYENGTVDKYLSYQLIQHLWLLDNDQFKRIFGIQTDQDADRFAKLLMDENVRSMKELTMKQEISCRVTYSSIRLSFNKALKFSFNDLTQEMLQNLFIDIENRIQFVNSGLDFIILHNFTTNEILKLLLNENDDGTEATTQIEHFNNKDHTFHAIIISSSQSTRTSISTSIQQLRLRYLTYAEKETSQSLKLDYPEDLVSLSLYRVKIENLCECKNLKNLYSQENNYTKEDVEQIKSLENVYSINDMYKKEDQNGKGLLYELCLDNKLQFVHVYNYTKDNGVLDKFAFGRYSDDLRVFSVQNTVKQQKIQLMNQNCMSKNLRVFYVVTGADVGKPCYGQLDEASKKEIPEHLIHNLM